MKIFLLTFAKACFLRKYQIRALFLKIFAIFAVVFSPFTLQFAKQSSVCALFRSLLNCSPFEKKRKPCEQVWGNINAPRAVTMSAIIYCLRCLVGHDIPLNQGCLNPVKVVIPPGSLLDPSEDAAVVGEYFLDFFSSYFCHFALPTAS
jgi:hypothetical protein